MKKICLNCMSARLQCKNFVKNEDGSDKYPFDTHWELATDEPITCVNIDSPFRFKPLADNNYCDCYKTRLENQENIKNYRKKIFECKR